MNRQGVGCMYLTVENIKSLDDIISGLNTIEDEKEKEQFLYQHIEDTDFFLETLKKLNKKKIPAKAKKMEKQNLQEIQTDAYQEEEIYGVLCKKSNEEIMREYSLSDLQKMYISVYKRKPASGDTKGRIISTLRNRMYTVKRAEAFGLAGKKNE